MSKVLVIDDDTNLSKTLATSLSGHGFSVIRSDTGEAGLAAAKADHPDVVVVDLGLPKMQGMEVIASVREWSSVPVVVLSARDQEEVKVAALDAGADDYLTKPFGIGELVARLRAAQRRSVRPDGQPSINCGTFVIDIQGKVVTKGLQNVRLTATEWRLLEALLGREGELVSHKELLHAGWNGSSRASVGYLRVYVAALRRKLEGDASKPEHIFTEPGMGYRFVR